jgi:hypothetical protein
LAIWICYGVSPELVKKIICNMAKDIVLHSAARNGTMPGNASLLPGVRASVEKKFA